MPNFVIYIKIRIKQIKINRATPKFIVNIA